VFLRPADVSIVNVRSIAFSLPNLQKDYENLESYIAELHVTFAVDVHSRLERLRQTIEELNSMGPFDAEGIDVSHVRRIDKARLILNRFSKNGRLTQILNKADDVEDDFAAAFLLGCLTTDNFWTETHEEAVFEGYAQIDGRDRRRHAREYCRGAFLGALAR
jgi:hypothetical protein